MSYANLLFVKESAMGKSKEKKRKLLPTEEVAEEKPRLSKEEDNIEVKMKAISENTEQMTAPVLGYFPSGYDPLKTSSESSSAVKNYKNVKSRNPKNPRTQLVVRVFRLEPKVEGSQLPEDEHADEPKEELTVAERDDNFRNLTVMYSTKKNIRRDVKQKTLRQTEGSAGDKEEMDQKLKAIKINTEALTSTNAVVSAQNIPPYDLDATTPDMAYPLDQIF